MSGDNFDCDRETARRIGAAMARVQILDGPELVALAAAGTTAARRKLAEQAAAMADAAIRLAVERRELPAACLGPDCLQAGIAHALEVLPTWQPTKAGLHTFLGKRAVLAALRAHNTERRRGLRGPAGYPDVGSLSEDAEYDAPDVPEPGTGRGDTIAVSDTLAYAAAPAGLEEPPEAAEALFAVEAVSRLPAAQKIAITRLYGLDGQPTATLREIADMLQIGHPEQVNRLVDDALNVLRGEL